MKKALFLTLMASVAFAACTSDESLVPPQEIDFQVAKYLSTSRAEGSVYEGGSFGTYSSGLTTEMNNTEISKVGDVWKAASGTYYWPINNGAVNFISYAPYNAVTFDVDDVDAANGEIEITDYTVGTDDLMIADYAVDLTSANYNADKVDDGTNSYSGVPTLFRHALANISFQFKNLNTTDFTYTVKSITVHSYKEGDLSLAATGTASNLMQTWGWPTVWDNPSSYTTTTFTVPTDPVTDDFAGLKSSEAFVLPQTFVNTGDIQKVVIVVDEKNNVNNTTTPRELTKNFYEITDHTAWEINKKIVYNITFNPTFNLEIHFDPAVAAWDTPTFGFEFN